MMSKPLIIQLTVSVACLLACLVVAETQRPPKVAEEWNEMYQQVFNPHPPREGIGMLTHLITMHQNIDRLGEQDLVTKDMIDRVKYWFNALSNANPKDCNARHMDNLKRELAKIYNPNDDGYQLMVHLVHRSLVEVCATYQIDVAAKMKARFTPAERAELDFYDSAYNTYAREKATIENLISWTFKRATIKRRYSAHRAISTWNKSACMKLIRNTPKSFLDFARLNSYISHLNAEDCKPAQVASWAWVINSCQQLDRIVRREIDHREQNPGKLQKLLRFQCLNFDDVCR